MDPRLVRAQQFLERNRPEEAQKILGAYIAEAPEHALAHSWMALASCELEQFELASDHARQATGLTPDDPYAWYVLAIVWSQRGEVAKAMEAIEEAIRLDPEDPDAFGLLGLLHLRKKKWKEALEAADRGLALDAENSDCTNVRAQALTQLGDAEGARQALAGQLSRSPEDPHTHANQGWVALHARDYDRALEHFREALRLAPENELARQGVIEALKAKHWFYKPVLRYFMWLGRFSTRGQVAILIGGWLAYRFAMSLGKQGGLLAPVFWTLVAAYLVFALSTWFAGPMAQALLSLHPFGRLATTRREKIESFGICGLLGLSLALAVIGWVQDSSLLVLGIALLVVCVPLQLLTQLEDKKSRRIMAGYAAATAIVGIAWFGMARTTHALSHDLRPLAEKVVAIEAERKEFAKEYQAQKAGTATTDDFEERARDLEARIAAVEKEMREANFIERAKAIQAKNSVRDTLGLVLTIMGFWVSQVLAGWLMSRGERR